jgi:hypothetical protein
MATLRSVVMIMTMTALAGCGSEATVWTIVPCSPQTCGGIRQNTAVLRLSEGEVRIGRDGKVEIKLVGLRTPAGQPAANKSLEVNFGAFAAGHYSGQTLGSITTDEKGNFDGPLIATNGQAFAFGSGAVMSGHFIFNDPGVRSEFVTGFAVP